MSFVLSVPPLNIYYRGRGVRIAGFQVVYHFYYQSLRCCCEALIVRLGDLGYFQDF